MKEYYQETGLNCILATAAASCGSFLYEYDKHSSFVWPWNEFHVSCEILWSLYL
jgi:hypothetical protein